MTREEKIDKRADEWGRIVTFMFPGTTYDPDTKMWDFTSNQDAVAAFTNYPEGRINLRSFSYVNEDMVVQKEQSPIIPRNDLEREPNSPGAELID